MNDKDKEVYDNYMERRELIQDVIDRLLSNPDYKEKLIELNKQYPALKDYNRNFEKNRKQ